MTRSLYDNAGQLLTVQKAVGTSIQQDYAAYTYTLNGRQRNVTDANGNRAELRYDGHDRQERWVFPSKTTAGALNQGDYESYGWDSAGNRIWLRKRDSTMIHYTYDNLDRVIVKSVGTSAAGVTGYTVHYAYNALDLQTHARFGSGTGEGIASSYDAFGRLTSSSKSMGGYTRALTYQYDAGGRRSRFTFADGTYFAYEYDPAGRLVAIRENGTTQVAGFGYDSAGRPQAKTFAGAAETYAYDAVSRLQSLAHDLGGTASDHGLTFAYNPASQIVSRTRSNDSYAAATPAAESRSYAVNGLNQYTAVAGAAHAYDPNGNLTSDGSTAYLYDTENRLVSASGAKTAGLSYDPLGRLHQTWGGAAGTTWFLYDGDELVAEYNGATMLRRYVHGIGVDDPVVWYEGGTLGQRRSLMADHQGSIVAVTDSTGNKLAINAYDSWGVPNASNVGRFQYTGQAWVPELGMYHYKARVYSPALGRFLQTDPVGYKDQVNLYGYVGNDPLNVNDPSGLKSEYAQSCSTAGSRLCSFAREAARRQEVQHAKDVARARGFLRGLVGVLTAILSLGGDTPQDNRTTQERFDDAFLNAADTELEGRRVGFHYTTQQAADAISKSGIIEQNRGRTYFTNEPYSPEQAARSVFLNAPTHAGRGEAVVIFTYDPRSFPSVPDRSTPAGRVHAGSIRNGKESVLFHYVGPNQFQGR